MGFADVRGETELSELNSAVGAAVLGAQNPIDSSAPLRAPLPTTTDERSTENVKSWTHTNLEIRENGGTEWEFS